MSRELNLCQFIGRLGADPDTKYMPSGDPVTSIRIAVGWKTKEKEGTEWVPVTFFGKLAEIAAEYLRKGSQIYVSGRFRTQSWEKDGQKHYRTEIVGEQMQMLGGKPQGERTPQRQQQKSASPPADDGGFDDDIPF